MLYFALVVNEGIYMPVHKTGHYVIGNNLIKNSLIFYIFATLKKSKFLTKPV